MELPTPKLAWEETILNKQTTKQTTQPQINKNLYSEFILISSIVVENLYWKVTWKRQNKWFKRLISCLFPVALPVSKHWNSLYLLLEKLGGKKIKITLFRHHKWLPKALKYIYTTTRNANIRTRAHHSFINEDKSVVCNKPRLTWCLKRVLY